MALALKGLNPNDTFNLVTFAGDTHVLFPEPVPATKDNLRKAQKFLHSRRGSGGTEMMKAIRTALEPSDSHQHIRIVCFMTDGYVGNDMAILDEVQQHPNARIFFVRHWQLSESIPVGQHGRVWTRGSGICRPS